MTSSRLNPIVLVTGINGYIASHVADQFLSAGYNVRGTVRALPKANNIKQVLMNKHGAERIQIVEVPDIAIDGAFDAVLEGTCTSNKYA